MRVYDAAPRGIRLATHEEGDKALLRWWNRLADHQQQAILEGRPLPERTPGTIRLFASVWALIK